MEFYFVFSVGTLISVFQIVPYRKVVHGIKFLLLRPKNLKSVSSQCARRKSSVARKPEVRPEIFKW